MSGWPVRFGSRQLYEITGERVSSVARPPALRITCVALDQTRVFRGVKLNVHARQDGKVPCRRQGSLPLAPKLPA
jgi:hypothetical protein